MQEQLPEDGGKHAGGNPALFQLPSRHGKLPEPHGRAFFLHFFEQSLPFPIGRARGKIVHTARIVRLLQKHQFFEQIGLLDEKSTKLVFFRSAVEIVHVPKDEIGGFRRDVLGRFQPFEDIARNPRALLGMIVRVPVPQRAERLSHVVEKRGQPHLFVGVQNSAQGMLENVVFMKVFTLYHVFTERKLGENFPEDARFLEHLQPLVMSARVIVAFVRLQNGAQLRPDAFGGNVADERGVGLRARETVGGGGKA